MGKRSNGEGSYTKLASGNWRCQIMDGRKPDGRPLMKSFTAPTKAEVMQKVREYFNKKEMETNTATSNSVQEENEHVILFRDWAKEWYAGYKTQVEASTYDNYRYTLNTLLKYWGSKELKSIKPAEINRMMVEMSESGASASKITKCKSMMIQIFNAAEENELVDRNPAIHSRIPKKQFNPDEQLDECKKDAFKEEEIQRILSNAPNNLMGNSICMLLGTGLRTQELLALRREDISEDGAVITVNKAIKMVKGQPEIGRTKSKRSCRIVPVPEEYRKYALFLRRYGGAPYIWTSARDDGLYAPKVFRNHYYKTLAEIPDIRKLSPHSCRHTYITRLQALGIPMEIVARLVGHSRITTTDGYTHTTTETLAKAVQVFNTGKDEK